ncbi:unnamed protein product [Clonostachys rosea]|uniref:TLC domain-containing protein n=1 Tax=Bionectria ochroleuca TaxID=29856 RepID=A0ABY6UM92_BIOOC|nr:unnamed protein product [Clonostachys rosea]
MAIDYESNLFSSRPFTRGIWALIMGSAYLTIFFYHTKKSIPTYQITFRKRSIIPLFVHILAGLCEILHFHSQAIYGRKPAPHAIDTALCVLHTVTTLHLSKTLVRGDITTRPSYQAGGILRLSTGLAAYIMKSSALHYGAVRMLNAFLYTRLLIYLCKRTGLDTIQSKSSVYSQSVFLGAVIAIYESGVSGAVPLYILSVGLVVLLNHHVSLGIGSQTLQFCRTLMLWLGLAELGSIRAHSHPPELDAGVSDQYVVDAEDPVEQLSVELKKSAHARS